MIDAYYRTLADKEGKVRPTPSKLTGLSREV